MDELISRITASVGIEDGKARNAVGLILGFLQKEGPDDKVASMLDGMDGARELIENADSEGGMLSGMMGGGVMGLGSKLMGLGLGMGEITSLSKETINFAKEKAGEETVDDVIASIPGLSQFV